MDLGLIDVHAGDFVVGKHNHQFLGDCFKMKVPGIFLKETIPATQISEVAMATEEEVKRLGGTIGWGVTGAVLLGPVGLLAGLLAGGRGKNVTFICKFKDGRKFLGTARSKTYTKILATQF